MWWHDSASENTSDSRLNPVQALPFDIPLSTRENPVPASPTDSAQAPAVTKASTGPGSEYWLP